MDFVAGESGPFFFCFDYAGRDAVDVEEMVRFAVASFEREFADGDAAAGRDISLVARLNDPASFGEQAVDVFACAVLGGNGHG